MAAIVNDITIIALPAAARKRESMMTTATQPPSTSAPALHDRTHLRPLDSVIQALEATTCTWCAGLLRLLKAHLEEASVPAFGQEVLN